LEAGALAFPAAGGVRVVVFPAAGALFFFAAGALLPAPAAAGCAEAAALRSSAP
jgi:hypothetical protein